jgi:hypothetical protein
MLLRGSLGFAAACVLALPAAALERDVTLRFLPPAASDVVGFRIYFTDEITQQEYTLDVGYVAPDPDGIARAAVVLDAERGFLVSMTAYNEATESELSNVIRIPPDTPICDPGLCDDGLSCTFDSCDAVGCLHTPLPNDSRCDDGDVDTVDDRCVAGVCEGVLLACRDDLECDDGNVCTGFETCGGTACIEGMPLACGAATECSTPFCDPLSGCGMAALGNGTPCDDGLDATTGDSCLDGVCWGGDEAPLLALEAVSPGAVVAGRWTLRVLGSGFEPGARLSLADGQGRPPRVRSLRLVDDQTLEAVVDVSRKGPKRARFWDVVVTLPDGREARLREALRVDP